MAKKLHCSHKDFCALLNTLVQNIVSSKWMPEHIIGVSRGGLVPAVYLSQYFDIPMSPVKFSLRDHTGVEVPESVLEIIATKNTLIIDDIFDSGETFHQLNEYFKSRLEPKNVKWAVIFNNTSATQTPRPDFFSYEINKSAHNPEWIVFNWENWWTNNNFEKTISD